ncbi:hypothetical protein AZ78_3025 [Lysobacter capsici AZ78]|uniref:Uncharacterized protein n=1 Tax=Lysobacter capsici AZ78 TaxID=1444315 RepID=A0A108UAB9_9GAMM|nr:hypothetical protein AZ78_3025 [Lysobacter capsici AZ78]
MDGDGDASGQAAWDLKPGIGNGESGIVEARAPSGRSYDSRLSIPDSRPDIGNRQSQEPEHRAAAFTIPDSPFPIPVPQTFSQQPVPGRSAHKISTVIGRHWSSFLVQD